MIGSALGLVGAGIVGLSRLDRVAPLAVGADSLEEPARALAAAQRLRPQRDFRNFPLDPLDGKCEVLANFGDCRGTSCQSRHEGIDIFGELGQPLYAMADGTLTKQYVEGGPLATRSGNAWVLAEPDETYYFYAHLSEFADGLVVGSEVVAGQVIGLVGESGNSDDSNPDTCNCHLHFEYHPGGGAAVDPLTVFEPPAGSVVFGS